jgi:hypothetical protein
MFYSASALNLNENDAGGTKRKKTKKANITRKQRINGEY